MQGLNLVVAEDVGEELGERRDNPREDAVKEEGIQSPCQIILLGAARQEHRLPLLVVVARRQWEHGGKVSLLGDGGHAEGQCRRGRRARASAVGFAFPNIISGGLGRRDSTDLEMLSAGRKGIWSKT